MHDEKIRYSSFRFLLSFPKLVKTVFHCLLFSKQNHEFIFVYPSFQTESISLSCAYDFDQDLLFEPHKNNDQFCEPHETIVDNTSIPHSSVSSNISLQITTSTLLSLMENPRILHLRNVYKPLNISWTFLK